VGIADVEPRASGEDRVRHGGPGAQTPVVDVAAEDARGDAADPAGLGRRNAHHAEVGTHRHPDRPAEGLPSRWVGRGDDARDVVEGPLREVEGELRRGHRLALHLVKAVDGDALLAEGVVEQPPVGRAVGPERQPRRHLEHADQERVAGLRALDGDRSGHHVDARAAVGLGDAGPQPADGVVHEQVRGIAGVVGDGLDAHDVAGADLEHRGLVPVEVTPVARVGRGQQLVAHARRGAPRRGQLLRQPDPRHRDNPFWSRNCRSSRQSGDQNAREGAMGDGGTAIRLR
jgi:hypothetical protein